MDDLLISLSNGTRIFAPASIEATTTYILLEQETWFEKEFGFVEHLLQPGMFAIDIGANLGTFTMAMAKAVGPSGLVVAYEPTTSTRQKLEATREANGALHVEVMGRALSDAEGTGRIVFDGTGELNFLGGESDGAGETVELTSLDLEAARFGWPSPYFVKIDAEGEELRILHGARRLLAEASPILMMELKAATAVDLGPIEAARELGFAPYRLLPGAALLVPLDVGTLDRNELNFFAIDERRAADLEARGLLVRDTPTLELTEADVEAALANLREQPFARAFPAQFAPDLKIHPQYRMALAEYGLWRDQGKTAAVRWAGLKRAYARLRELCDHDGRIGRMATLARVAAEAGESYVAGGVVELILREAAGGRLSIGEPFWPVRARFDTVPMASRPAEWFLAGLCEQMEILHAFSTIFAPPTVHLDWLCASGFGTAEMARRRCLSLLRGGVRPDVPDIVRADAADNLNAALWRNGSIAALR